MKKRVIFTASHRTVVGEKVKEAFTSVLPIFLIALLLCFTITPVDNGVFVSFLVGGFLTIIGMGFFTLGADTAMTPIGEYIGTSTVRSRKLWLIVVVFFILGVLITVSEPDLQVLASQLKDGISSGLLIITVGIGVGFFLVVAILRTILKIKLSYILLISYGIVFVLGNFFVPKEFVAIAFDSGGVTTGPMSVPFIMAIGTGVASLRTDKGALDDGFGFTALCSIGPILAVMILGTLVDPSKIHISENALNSAVDSKEMIVSLGKTLPTYIEEVAIALLPIIAFYLLFRLFGRRTGDNDVVKILIGVVYTYIGLVLFLTGVNFGFLPVGTYIGKIIGGLNYNWIIIPIGAIMGFFVVAAEPAVHVLVKQVYQMTDGAIPKNALLLSLMIGVGVSIGLAMLRIILHVNIMWLLIPGYAVALILAFIVPEIFTAIAFDSGGVASGAMTAGFLLPLALGLCRAVGGNVAVEGFGLVAMVAMTPLLTIQILGLIFKIKTTKLKNIQEEPQEEREKIID